MIGLTQLCDSIRNTLIQTPVVGKALLAASPAQFKEGMLDLPMVQIYPENGDTDARASGTAQTTFRGEKRVNAITIFADAYVRQRSHIGEDMAKTLIVTDAIIETLERQKVHPYFDNEAIKGFKWTWERVTLVYGDPEQRYVGTRFTLSLTVF